VLTDKKKLLLIDIGKGFESCGATFEKNLSKERKVEKVWI